MISLLLRQPLRHGIVANSDLAFKQEVHVRDFVLHVKNQAVLLLIVELGRFQAEANFVKEVLVHHLFALVTRDEEGPEPKDYIVEEVMKQDMVLYLLGALLEVLVIEIH